MMLGFVEKLLSRFLFCFVFRTRVVGNELVPSRGSLLVVANHISWFDPALLSITIPRRLNFLAMAELFRHPFIGRMMSVLGGFPVDRSKPGQTPVRWAIQCLRGGGCLVIFPEGGIRLGEKSVLGGNPAFQQGAGMIGWRSQAAILPVVIRGSRKPHHWQNWFRRETLSVTIGNPFCFWVPRAVSPGTARQQATDQLRKALLETTAL